jgi:hypothetical protein
MEKGEWNGSEMKKLTVVPRSIPITVPKLSWDSAEATAPQSAAIDSILEKRHAYSKRYLKVSYNHKANSPRVPNNTSKLVLILLRIVVLKPRCVIWRSTAIAMSSSIVHVKISRFCCLLLSDWSRASCLGFRPRTLQTHQDVRLSFKCPTLNR